ncbi:MAG: DUF3035 domain-containing protein [Pelagibacterales bacterium]|nr:DUF3035 domain-containing protein [Pelagibacterales bacterium]
MIDKVILLLIFLVFLNTCQSVKDGLGGRKQENSDEFLVEKKNPLELPPDYGELPTPKTDKDENKISEKIDEKIEKLFKNVEENESTTSTSDPNRSAEDFVLKQIKNN